MKHLNKKEGEQRVLFKAIQPNILSKEPLTLSHPSREHNILSKDSKKKPYILSTEPYLKRSTCIIHQKSPTCSRQALYSIYCLTYIIYQKSHTCSQKSPISAPAPELASPLSLSKEPHVLSMIELYFCWQSPTYSKRRPVALLPPVLTSPLFLQRALYSI